MSENNDASIESNCFQGGFTLKASRLHAAVLRPAVLGPSVLGANIHNSSTSTAPASSGSGDQTEDEKPSGGGGGSEGIANNPFLREQKDEDQDEGAAVVESSAKSEKDENEVEERPDPLNLLRNNGIEQRANIFAAVKTTMPRVESSGFVFGQNVHERVVGENVTTDSSAEASSSGSSGAASTQLLFSSVIQKAAKSTENNEGAQSKEAEAKSLNDVAREYEESRAQKRKYEEVETFTGEENEINIADVSCKLFAFVNSNWEERGRGSLRLNDAMDKRDCSRVVFRTSGNLRLLLNTKVWAAMVAERASQKSLRLTAMDNTGTVKVFLAMGRPADIAQLYKALSERINKRKLTHPEECVAAASGSTESAKNGQHAGEDCVTTIAKPESTTNDDDDDEEDALDEDETVGDEQAEAEAAKSGTESDEPSPKKPALVVVVADSSADVMQQDESQAGGSAEAPAAQN